MVLRETFAPFWANWPDLVTVRHSERCCGADEFEVSFDEHVLDCSSFGRDVELCRWQRLQLVAEALPDRLVRNVQSLGEWSRHRVSNYPPRFTLRVRHIR